MKYIRYAYTIFFILLTGMASFGQSGAYIIRKTDALEKFITSGNPANVEYSNDFANWLKVNQGEVVNSEALVNNTISDMYFVVYRALFRVYYFQVPSERLQSLYYGRLSQFVERIVTQYPGAKGRIFASVLTAGKNEKLKWGKPAGSYSLSSNYSTGLSIDKETQNAAEVFVPLADWQGDDTLPHKISMADRAPVPGNQGTQGSCTAWATAYAAMTILTAIDRNIDGDDCKMSPSFVYNQLAGGNCKGTNIENALQLLVDKGSVPFNRFEYDENDCARKPAKELVTEAKQNVLSGYSRVFIHDDKKPSSADISEVKRSIFNGFPVIIGMYILCSFQQDPGSFEEDHWYSTAADYAQYGIIKDSGWHAMCVIGYDDNCYGPQQGGFLLMNSWGSFSGTSGIVWIRYEAFRQLVQSGYSAYLYRKESMRSNYTNKFEISVVLNNRQQTLSGTDGFSGYIAALAQPATPSSTSRFQLRVKNNMPCYTYIFKINNATKLTCLFPEANQSPFFIVKGSRFLPVIPCSLNVGETSGEYIVIVSGDPVNTADFARQFGMVQGKTAGEKLNSLLKETGVIRDTNLADNQIDFSQNWSENTGRNGAVIKVGWAGR